MRALGKRAARVVGGSVVSLVLALAVVVAITATDSGAEVSIAWLVLLSSCLLICVAMVVRRLSFKQPSSRARRASRLLRSAETFADIEVGVALVTACFAAMLASGRLESPLHPMIYGVVAFCAAAQRQRAVFVVVAIAFAFEVAMHSAGSGSLVSISSLAHMLFVGFAAVSHILLFRGLVRRARQHFRSRVAAAIEAQAESARDYRLIGAALNVESRPNRARTHDENLLAAGSAEVVRANAYHSLTLLRRSLDAETAALLWLDPSGTQLKIKELDSDSLGVVDSGSIAVGGVLGAVIREVAPVVLDETRPRQVGYYQTSDPVGAFVGVPVLDGAHVRGILALNRSEPWAQHEIALVENAAEQLMRIVHSERVFAALERAKYEHERFFQATAMLGRALTFEDVVETAFEAAGQIAANDLAVITLYDHERHRHRVVGSRVADGSSILPRPETLVDLEYRDNQGLVAMVVKNRHFLPASGDFRDNSAPIFTRKVKIKGAESLLVLPLLSGDGAIGTFTFASSKPGVFRSDIRDMLGVIANQVAVSLENGLIYKKMETMATTDGLTGLTNHRTFQELFDDLLGRAHRHGLKAAMLLCDIDHFKSVNDTYGHPIGDEVLRQVSEVLRKAVRKIDIPARYGGEEFAVVLEAANLEGAVQLAERIRNDVASLVIASDKGSFSVTMSIGVSAFPDDSTDKAELIERADLALYHAKETGRNRVVTFAEFKAVKRRRAG